MLRSTRSLVPLAAAFVGGVCFTHTSRARLQQGEPEFSAASVAGGGASSIATTRRPSAANGKTIKVDRNVVMTCGNICGGLTDVKIVKMEEADVRVDFVAARGFFRCYHRCIARRKATKVTGQKLVEESIIDVEGVGPGVSPRWVEAKASELRGRVAIWRVILTQVVPSSQSDGGEDIVLFEGNVSGKIVPPSTSLATAAVVSGLSGFADFNRPGDGTEGFERVFVPDSQRVSLAEYLGPSVDARHLAYAAYTSGQPSMRMRTDSAEATLLAEIDSKHGRGQLSDDPVEDMLAQMSAGLPSCG